MTFYHDHLKTFLTFMKTFMIVQGCHWSGKSQGILELVREIWNFIESQGNFKEICFIRGCGDQKAYIKNFGLRLRRTRHIFQHTSF